MWGRVKKLAGFMLLVALVAVGCGGGDESAETKAEFVKHANAICKRMFKEQVDGVAREQKRTPLRTPTAEAERKVILSGWLPPLDDGIEQLEQLSVPSGDEDQVDALMAAIEKGKTETERSPRRIEIYFVEADKLAAGYGLKGCAEALVSKLDTQ